MDKDMQGGRRACARAASAAVLFVALASPQLFAQQDAAAAGRGAAGTQSANAAAKSLRPGRQQTQPPKLVLRVGGGHSDNLLRTPSAEEAGSYNMAGLSFGFARSSSRMDALLNGDLERRNYSVAGIDSEVYGTFDGSVELQAVPDLFSWLVGDNYGQARRDPFRIDSPVNRQHVNVASTGPRLNLPLGRTRRNVLRVSGTVARRSYQQTSVFDGDTTTTELGFVRAISNRANVGLTASGQRADYNNLPARNSDVRNAYLSYQSRLAAGSASLDLGTSRAELAGTAHSRPYVNLRWENDLGAWSHLALTASSQYIDAGSAFALATATNEDVQRLQDTFATADVYQHSVAGLAYTMTFPRTSVQIGASKLRDRYETDLSYDNDRRQVDFGISHELGVGFDAGITVFRSKRKFSSSAQDDTDQSQELWIRKRFAGRVSLQLRYQHDVRSSTVAGNGFHENMVRLVFLADMSPRATSLGVTNIGAAVP